MKEQLSLVTVVRTENLFKSFKSTRVLNDINIQIKEREFVSLLGPSGCGKSTLLRILAGLEKLDTGDVFIGDRCVNNVHSRDRDIAMVFQNYALYPQMNVFNNIAFSLQVKKRPKAEIKAKVSEAAKILNIQELLLRFPAELSGGQRQRVAMGRAIVRNPKVFLFDEPLSNLDAKLRERMRFEIRKLHNNLNATTLYVTHDQIEAMTMSDRIIIMDKGTIQQIGTPSEVFDQPVNTFVADFIGTPAINLLTGKIIQQDGIAMFQAEDTLFPIPPDIDLQGKREVIYGVRPRDLRILTAADSRDKFAIKLNVVLMESTGTETLFRFSLGERELTVVNQGRYHEARDKNFLLRVEPKQVHLFDPVTKEKLT